MGGMEHVSERPTGREAVQSALIAAARDLIERQGVGVSTRDIAQAARVNQGLITRYFGSKEALLKAVAQQITQEMVRAVETGELTVEAAIMGLSPWFERSMRVLIRMLLDRAEPQESLADHDLLQPLLAWIGLHGRGNDGLAVPTKIYIIGSFIIGRQLMSGSLSSDLNLQSGDLERVRRASLGFFQDFLES